MLHFNQLYWMLLDYLSALLDLFFLLVSYLIDNVVVFTRDALRSFSFVNFQQTNYSFRTIYFQRSETNCYIVLPYKLPVTSSTLHYCLTPKQWWQMGSGTVIQIARFIPDLALDNLALRPGFLHRTGLYWPVCLCFFLTLHYKVQKMVVQVCFCLRGGSSHLFDCLMSTSYPLTFVIYHPPCPLVDFLEQMDILFSLFPTNSTPPLFLSSETITPPSTSTCLLAFTLFCIPSP